MQQFSWRGHLAKFGKILALAPMDGWTCSAFRTMVKGLCPQVMAFTEFVSVDGLTHHRRSQRLFQKALLHNKAEKPLVVQLFGQDPEKFALAAKLCQENAAGAVDLNFGCPARKVLHANHGGAILKNPELAQEIVRATCGATDLEVSVKTRLGFFQKDEIFPFAEKMFQSGAACLTVHGRTVKQGFAGQADLKVVCKLKEMFPEKIIVANGDLGDWQSAREILQKVDGVMIGRKAFENPWIFQEILHGEDFANAARFDFFLNFLRTRAAQVGEKNAVLQGRKIFAALTKGQSNAKALREKIFQIPNLAGVADLLGKSQKGDLTI